MSKLVHLFFLIFLIFLFCPFMPLAYADTGSTFYSYTTVNLKNKTTMQGLSIVGSEYVQISLTCFTDFNVGYQKKKLPKLECINPFSARQIIRPLSRNYVTFTTGPNSGFGDGGTSSIELIRTDSGLCQITKIPFTKIDNITYHHADLKNGKKSLEILNKECLHEILFGIEGNLHESSADWPGNALFFWQNVNSSQQIEMNDEQLTKYSLYVKAVDRFWSRCQAGSTDGEAALKQATIDLGLMRSENDLIESIIRYTGLHFFLKAVDALNKATDQEKLGNLTRAFETCPSIFQQYVETHKTEKTVRTPYWQILGDFINANLSEKDREPYLPLLKQLGSSD